MAPQYDLPLSLINTFAICAFAQSQHLQELLYPYNAPDHKLRFLQHQKGAICGLSGNWRKVSPNVGRIANPPCAKQQICWFFTAIPKDLICDREQKFGKRDLGWFHALTIQQFDLSGNGNVDAKKARWSKRNNTFCGAGWYPAPLASLIPLPENEQALSLPYSRLTVEAL